MARPEQSNILEIGARIHASNQLVGTDQHWLESQWQASAVPPGTNDPLHSSSTRSAWVSIVLVASCLAGVNATKPLVIDDTAYIEFARHIAADPTDPYGFEIFWNAAPEPANRVLAPPALLYWHATWVRLAGERPVIWKIALFPFALLLAYALHGLFARFARGFEIPLLWLTVLSPAIFPALNLMLDVPALAIGLASLLLFVRSCDRRRPTSALLAGVLAGLAMQTKYTAFTTTAAMGIYALCFGRWRMAALAGAGASVVFLGWETLTALLYGQSHFLSAALRNASEPSGENAAFLWFLSLLSILGATAPGFALLGLLALRAPRPILVAGGLFASLCFAVIPLFPRDPIATWDSLPNLSAPKPELFVFVVLGSGAAAIFAVCSVRLLRSRRDQQASSISPDPDRASVSRFLALWLALEIAAFFLLSPFPASRRAMGVTVALAVVIGQLATRALRTGAERRLVYWVAGWGVALGSLYAVTDYLDAVVRRDAVELASARLGELGFDPVRQQVWFLGHWGVQFYAKELRMRPLVPGISRLRAGDWLLDPAGVDAQEISIFGGATQKRGVVMARNSWPWSTLPSSYVGPTPIRAQAKSQIVVVIHRVEYGFVPPAR